MNAQQQVAGSGTHDGARRRTTTASKLIRWTGLSAMAAGIIFAVIQPIHPPDVLASVTTGPWAAIQFLKSAMCLLGLIGIAGLYVRQIEESGPLGLVGAVLLGLFYATTLVFAFAEAAILPLLATDAPAFVTGFLAILTGDPRDVALGTLPGFFALNGAAYLLGGLLFGIATFRAGVLPRPAGALLAVAGPLSAVMVALLPHALERFAAVPMGAALVWLGYALWSERREETSAAVGRRGRTLRRAGTE